MTNKLSTKDIFQKDGYFWVMTFTSPTYSRGEGFKTLREAKRFVRDTNSLRQSFSEYLAIAFGISFGVIGVAMVATLIIVDIVSK